MIRDSQILYLEQDRSGLIAIQELDVGSYPSGEPLIKNDSWGDIRRVLLRPQTMFSFMAAMFWVDALAERGRDVPELVLPYVPGARRYLEIFGAWYWHDLNLPVGTVWECGCGKVWRAVWIDDRHAHGFSRCAHMEWREETRRERRKRLRGIS